MDLYVLRHGLAVERGDKRYPRDEDRPLTAEGQKKTLKVARRMKELGMTFDLILSSPLPRARQTAEITASVLGCKNRLRFSEHLGPDGSQRALVDDINKRKKRSVLLVGHEPYLSEFISLLLMGKPGLQLVFKKGGLCKIEVERLRFGRCGVLEFLMTPRTMI